MTICPIAIAIGCKKCPIFKICPVKSLIGDVPKAAEAKPVAKPVAKRAPARKKTK
jgi:hypothetical protein